jgi:hypothetical protein
MGKPIDGARIILSQVLGERAIGPGARWGAPAWEISRALELERPASDHMDRRGRSLQVLDMGISSVPARPLAQTKPSGPVAENQKREEKESDRTKAIRPRFVEIASCRRAAPDITSRECNMGRGCYAGFTSVISRSSAAPHWPQTTAPSSVM